MPAPPGQAPPVAVPVWQVLLNGTDITQALGAAPIRMEYREAVSAKACSLDMSFADPGMIMQNGPPTIGALLSLSLGYQGGALTACGDFQIDEFVLQVSPDTFGVKAIQAGLLQPIRTQNSVAYENKTLLQIANTVAARHGFTVVGSAVSPDVVYKRVTQNLEPDLAFLHRIANQHNYDFTIRNSQLIFYSRPALEAQAPTGTITRDQITRGHFTTQTLGARTYSGSTVSYFDPTTKSLISSAAMDRNVPTSDTLKSVERIENGQQSSLRAQGYLHEHNMFKGMTMIEMPGNLLYRAGNVVAIAGFGIFDQVTYLVQEAAHDIAARTGWTTELSLRATITGTSAQAVS